MAASWQLTYSPLNDRLLTGARIEYTCGYFHEFLGNGSNVLTCLGDGSWTPQFPRDCVQGCLFVLHDLQVEKRQVLFEYFQTQTFS